MELPNSTKSNKPHASEKTKRYLENYHFGDVRNGNTITSKNRITLLAILHIKYNSKYLEPQNIYGWLFSFRYISNLNPLNS